MPSLSIFKLGGKLLSDEHALNLVVQHLSTINSPKILVHGGGKQASELCQKLGITPQLINGRRITDQKTMEVVTMVYAGLINKHIVSLLQSQNCNAIGLSGADGNLILSEKRRAQDIDYGFAGDIKTINAPFITDLLGRGCTPVFCAITHNGLGQLLNTNADTIASSLATALSNQFEVTLKFCFEMEGVLANPLDQGSVIPSLSKINYQQMKKKGLISKGMIPKLDNAFAAKSSDVERVVICGINGMTNQKGTEICL